MGNVNRILAIGVLAVIALLLGWVAFLELFVAGFQPVVVEHGVGRPMLASEVWRHAVVGAALAGASIALVILGFRLANTARRRGSPN